MGFEWLSWFGSIIKLIGDLIPQRILVEPTHEGVKFRGMKKVVRLEPGRYWYWPYMTTVYTMPVVQQTLELGPQTLLTRDNQAVRLESSITYQVTDIVLAMGSTYEVVDQIDDEAMSVICDYITSREFQELHSNRLNINNDITEAVGERLSEYGISVLRAQIKTFTTGNVLIHVGSALEFHNE